MNCPRSMRILLFLAMLALPGFHHASGETLNRVVAIVNDDLVTLYELNKKIRELTGRTPVELRSQNEDQYYEIRGKILELLIDDKIKQAKVLEPGDMVAQTRIAMENVARVLDEFGATLDDVVKVTTFYQGSASAEALHENLLIRSNSYIAPGPATTGIPVPNLIYEDMVIEIEVIAMLENDKEA